MIDKFEGEYTFLSNTYLRPMKFEGLEYTNAESCFQSCKFRNPKSRKVFTNMGPNSAYLKGRHVTLRDDWEDVKDRYMYRVLRAKFDQNPDLIQKLIDTGDEEIINTNTKHDNYWGFCTCDKCAKRYHHNQIGTTLMKLRGEYQKKAKEANGE